MSRGAQHRSWPATAKTWALMEKVEAAVFFPTGDFGLTSQSCRFCRVVPTSGLWKYSVRHYICSECRRGLLRPSYSDLATSGPQIRSDAGPEEEEP